MRLFVAVSLIFCVYIVNVLFFVWSRCSRKTSNIGAVPKYVLNKEYPHLLMTTTTLHSSRITTNPQALSTLVSIQRLSSKSFSTSSAPSYDNSTAIKADISTTSYPWNNTAASDQINIVASTKSMFQLYHREGELQSNAVLVVSLPTDNSTNLTILQNLSPGLYSLNSFVQLAVYVANNMERALNIIFGVLSLCLFCTVILLLCYHARTRNKASPVLSRNERLLQPRANPSTMYARNSLSSRDGRHSRAGRGRHRCLTNCCTCHVFSRCFHPVKDIAVPPQVNYSDTEDVISVPGAESAVEHHGALSRDEFFDNYSPRDRMLSEDEMEVASEYEFPDEANKMTLEAGCSGLVSFPQSNLDTQLIEQPQPTFSSSTENYPPSRHNVGTSFPRYAVPCRSATQQTYQQIVAVGAPYSDSRFANVRAPRNHYVSLQPQTVDAWPGRRASIYDNSLPRDGVLYEFYRSESYHQELPGTRNINHYFS